MLREFEQTLQERIIGVQAKLPIALVEEDDYEEEVVDEAEQAAEEAREEERQAAWGKVFSATETLLQEQGHRVGVGLKRGIRDKFDWFAEQMSHGFPPPWDITQTSRIWGKETDIDLDGEAQRVSIYARARLLSPANADVIIISVGEVMLSMSQRQYRRKNEPQEVSVGLSIGDQEVYMDLSDANFFNEVITRTGQQASGAAPISLSRAKATQVLRPRRII